jgi:hypothetical protein
MEGVGQLKDIEQRRQIVHVETRPKQESNLRRTVHAGLEKPAGRRAPRQGGCKGRRSPALMTQPTAWQIAETSVERPHIVHADPFQHR